MLEDVFEQLVPGNGKLATLMWASAVATAKGDPNIVTILGNPGEGKTVLMEYVLRFIPENYVIKLNEATIAALLTDTYELGNDYLDGKIVYLGDLGATTAWEDSADVRRVLRTLLTDGHWSRKLTDKVDMGGKVSEKIVKHEKLTGKPAMWFTTVKEGGDGQDKDRSIIATTNLSKENEIIYLIQHLNKSSRTGKRIRGLLDEMVPIVHSIFQALVEADEEVIIPWNISNLKFKFRDSATVVNITSLLGLINKEHRRRFGPFILPDEQDLIDVLTLLDKGSGNLSELVMKRLNMIYDAFKADHLPEMMLWHLMGSQMLIHGPIRWQQTY